ncbi:MAG: hypothetical protein GY859_08075 [Desulfobacterales bacterium]|nr:hypothetical protein [Desulfobacterales bacterium]
MEQYGLKQHGLKQHGLKLRIELLMDGAVRPAETEKEMFMYKTFFWGIALLALVVVFSACGGKYDDVVEVNTEFADAAENYIEGLDKAGGADDVADAVNTFADKMEKLGPRMKELADKYPELKNPDNLPEELKASRERVDAMGMKIGGAMMKTMKYMNSSKVMEAQKHLQQAMAKMR